MDFTEINALLDAATSFILNYGTKEKDYQQQLADKDKQIADLQAQLTTVTASVKADETELTALHDKLTQLAGVLNPPSQAPAVAS